MNDVIWTDEDEFRVEVETFAGRKALRTTDPIDDDGLMTWLPTERGDVYKLLTDLSSAMGFELHALVRGVEADARQDVIPDELTKFVPRHPPVPMPGPTTVPDPGWDF